MKILLFFLFFFCFKVSIEIKYQSKKKKRDYTQASSTTTFSTKKIKHNNLSISKSSRITVCATPAYHHPDKFIINKIALNDV